MVGSDQVLTYAQVDHLQRMVSLEMSVIARGSNPTLTMTPQQLIESVRERLTDAGIGVEDIRINGSAASCVVSGDRRRPYNDLDVLFNLSGGGGGRPGSKADDPTRHDRIRSAALSALVDFFPDDRTLSQAPTTEELSEMYVHKMVKVENSYDQWSLISLQNHSGCNIELKFVDSMRRKYQFSIDSFQVIIDSYLLYVESSPIPMNERFFPTVVAQTFYGNFDDALKHLRHKLIATHNPEEIRGGGLLKYCGLLACNYRPAENVDAQRLEKYMCARFFIDFPVIELQKVQLENYLENHFVRQEDQRGLFLVLVINVIQRSAFCLPAQERDSTLQLIHQMAIEVTFYPEIRSLGRCRSTNVFDQNVEHRPPFFTAPRRSSGHQSPDSSPPRMPCSHCDQNCLKSNRIYTQAFVFPVIFTNTFVIPDRN